MAGLLSDRYGTSMTALVCACLFAGSGAARGQEASLPEDEIVVTGQYQFLDVDTRGTTNLPLPIEDVPQSISLVSEDFIKAANLRTLGDIGAYTPGAINAGNPTNNGTVIKLRGFSAGRAIDGINAIATYVSYEPDFAIFERLEIVQGPSSVVYGISSPGGLVNYATKSARANTPSYLLVKSGSWKAIRVEGQVAGALDKDGNVRAIGLVVHDGAESFIDELSRSKTVIYGGLDVDFSDTFSGFVHAGYEKYRRTSFDGIPVYANGVPAAVPRSFFLGSRDISTTSRTTYATSNLRWAPSEDFELTLKGNYEDARQSGAAAYAYNLLANGDARFQVNRRSAVRTVNYGIGASAIYKLDSLGLAESFISLAALYQDSDQKTTTRSPAGTGTINIFDTTENIRLAFNNRLNLPLNPFASFIRTQTMTLAGQAVIKPVDAITLLIGASYSKPDAKRTTNGAVQIYDVPGQVSLRAGLTYEVAPSTNVYVSYSESFSPQPRLMVNQDVLPPLSGEQWEVGIKSRTLDGRLLLTAAAYHIVQTNFSAFDRNVSGIDYYRPVGEVRHQGFEVKALGELGGGFQINAGYAYLDARVNRDTNAAAVGQRALYLPKNTFSAFGIYSANQGSLAGLSIGGGVRYVDAVRTSYTGASIDIPGYTVVDASLGYDIDDWSLQLNIENIFDKTYYINNYQTLLYGNMAGNPANFSLSVTRRF
ncbi:TonB-dependent siderophore receptor [Sphingomonas sp. LT1P40]|uniref:TonB-dependent siderophore receptor n=1 Tax=Alteristakelama amylovorans TaxID=3096166 RepID=UPI002FCC21F4